MAYDIAQVKKASVLVVVRHEINSTDLHQHCSTNLERPDWIRYTKSAANILTRDPSVLVGGHFY